MSSAFMTFLLAVSELSHGAVSTVRLFCFSNFDSETLGEVVKSKEIRRVVRTTVRGYKVEYKYTVNGREYRGSTVNFKSIFSDVEDVLEKYFVGREVVVHYDSKSPEQAVLEKGYLGVDYWLGLPLMMFMSVFLSYFIALYLWK